MLFLVDKDSDLKREGLGSPFGEGAMVIAIAADLHDNLTNWSVFIQQIHDQHVAEIWLAGDIGTSESFATLCQETTVLLKAVPGNVEEGHRVTKYADIAAQHKSVTWVSTPPLSWKINDFSFAMVHHPEQMEECFLASPTDVLVYGHTHRPALSKRNTTWIVNPGTLGGVFLPATYTLATIEPTGISFSLRRLFNA